jgi:hypothetical protein
VFWDTTSDRIVLVSDQSGMVPITPKAKAAVGSFAQQHLLAYEGTDAFGLKLSTQITLDLPAGLCDVKKLLYEVTVWPNQILPDPPWAHEGPMGRRRWVSEFAGHGSAAMGLLRRELGEHPLARQLATTLSSAILKGHARIGAAEAAAAVSVLLRKGSVGG